MPAVCGASRKQKTLGFKINSPECFVNDGESKLKILHDSVDPAVFSVQNGERGPREEKGYIPHSHSFNDSIDLVSPLRSFCLPPIKHDTMLNLSTHAPLPKSDPPERFSQRPAESVVRNKKTETRDRARNPNPKINKKRGFVLTGLW